MSTKHNEQKGGTPDVHSSDLLALRHTLGGLKYMAASPPQKWGGFHPSLVLTAQSALHHIARLRAKLRANDKLSGGGAAEEQQQTERTPRRPLE